MKKCSKDCTPMCDFCVHYNSNVDERGIYHYEGWCNLNDIQSDPDDDCKEFYCARCEAEEIDRIIAQLWEKTCENGCISWLR